MARYKPSKAFDTPMLLFTVSHYVNWNGVQQPVYKTTGILFYGSFATYGGTETTVNGIMVVEDTATVETWYRPEFKAEGRVSLATAPGVYQYEIVGEPENIEQRNLYTKMKLRRIRGGA